MHLISFFFSTGFKNERSGLLLLLFFPDDFFLEMFYTVDADLQRSVSKEVCPNTRLHHSMFVTGNMKCRVSSRSKPVYLNF